MYKAIIIKKKRYLGTKNRPFIIQNDRIKKNNKKRQPRKKKRALKEHKTEKKIKTIKKKTNWTIKKRYQENK